jgi:putative PIN family toxin of toxin-antitoxin system
MRVVLDTPVLVAALITPHHPPDRVFQAWLAGAFTLVTSIEQLEEFRRVTRYPRLRPLIEPAAAGTMLNTLAAVAVVLKKLPAVDRSPDPGDNFVLAMAEAGEADYSACLPGSAAGRGSIIPSGRPADPGSRRPSI